ncbi:hypothetical protein ABBQ32_003883 [Trebouxia sp. C0010 RCD-2024]
MRPLPLPFSGRLPLFPADSLAVPQQRQTAPAFLYLNMEVREARVWDHDELLPIIARAQLRCPALAQVPGRDESQTDYALASLIGQQGPQDKVFVAQSRGQLLGCMAVTSTVDVSPLQQNFDLHVYDQLVQPDVYEALLSVHGQQAAAETGSVGGGDGATQQLATAYQSVLQV